MKIKRICIENFRSIDSLEIHPSEICALVGENNAGKTNVLSALNFLLGEAYPVRQRLDVTDYHNENTEQPIKIDVEFESNEAGISHIWCDMPYEERGAVMMTYFNGNKPYRLSNDVREKCALVYLDAGRSLEYHLGYSRWTLFGRIIRQLDENFRENFSERQTELEEHFERAHEVLRTDLYEEFYQSLRDSFSQQLSRTSHELKLDFRTFDLSNYYRSIRPTLIEEGQDKSPTAAGQGMRNLIVLSLFRAYAKVFKGDAIIAIEEPETYLHPHAQRSLSGVFDELAKQGNQIFYSTHSGNFVDVHRFKNICIVEKRLEDNALNTDIRQVSAQQLLGLRQKLYPTIDMSVSSMSERYRSICNLEHNEAFFAKKVILVEGDSEEYALPIYAEFLGYDFDAEGVSIVNAHGKLSLDSFYQLYTAFGIPTYPIFDNDRGSNKKERDHNKTLLGMLGEAEELDPDGVVESHFAVIEGNYESATKADLETQNPGRYDQLIQEAKETLGENAGKGLKARFLAQKLVEDQMTPSFIREIVEAAISLDNSKPMNNPSEDEYFEFSNGWSDEEIPF